MRSQQSCTYKQLRGRNSPPSHSVVIEVVSVVLPDLGVVGSSDTIALLPSQPIES